MLYPADVIPDRALTITLWVRSSDLKGHGTIVSYAAFLRQAFNLRVSHKVSAFIRVSVFWFVSTPVFPSVPCLPSSCRLFVFVD